MAFNGSGVFVRLYNWVNDAAASIFIRADRMDNEMNGFATGLSNCITKDGQTTVTANLPMATFKHTGVGDATARTQYSSFGQVQDGKINWAVAGGTADAITATYSVPITSLVDGQLCFVRATAANATTTPTFSPSALTARTIVKNGGAALVAGDISADGHELVLRYDLTNTRWELLNPTSVLPPFIDSVALVKGSADTTKLLKIEVDGITTSTTRTWTAPDADLTVVGTTTAQTLTNKTLTDPVLNGSLTGTAIKDEDDMASNSAVAVPTQQSVKAYVDGLVYPTPKSGTGVGQWTTIGGTISTDVVLPSGGTWGYWAMRFSSTGTLDNAQAAGVAAGGTTVLSVSSGKNSQGFAWRIT